MVVDQVRDAPSTQLKYVQQDMFARTRFRCHSSQLAEPLKAVDPESHQGLHGIHLPSLRDRAGGPVQTFPAEVVAIGTPLHASIESKGCLLPLFVLAGTEFMLSISKSSYHLHAPCAFDFCKAWRAFKRSDAGADRARALHPHFDGSRG